MTRFGKTGLMLAALFAATVAFADVKISDLPAGTTLGGTEPVPAVQSGSTVKTTPAAIATYTKSVTTSANTIAQFTGTCSAGTFLRGDGACAAPSGSGTTGSFTATWTTGCTANPTTLVNWTLDSTGTVVTLTLNPQSPATCTSNSASFTTNTGDVPANLRPTTSNVRTCPIFPLDNGVALTTPGCLTVTTTGQMSARVGANGNWTNTGLKAVNTGPDGSTIVYRLN